MKRVLRAPTLHFLVLGGLLFLGSGPRPASRGRIILTADDVARLRREWTLANGVAPGPAAEAALVAEAVDDDILQREALAAGLDRTDGAVRERLVRLGGFLGEEPEGEAALERQARSLGLERSDLVIRRHLVQMMRLAARRVPPSELPSDAELERWLAAHAEEFVTPDRVRLTQVYLSRERRGDALAPDAERLLADLRRDGVGPDAAAARGDPFLRGAETGPVSREELERTFGQAFADGSWAAEAKRWVGPLPSPWGVHLVWIQERLPATLPPLEAVRGRVVHRVLEERGAELARTRLDALRARYDVAVERR